MHGRRFLIIGSFTFTFFALFLAGLFKESGVSVDHALNAWAVISIAGTVFIFAIDHQLDKIRALAQKT